MSYCPHCLVQLKDQAPHCPLCGAEPAPTLEAAQAIHDAPAIEAKPLGRKTRSPMHKPTVPDSASAFASQVRDADQTPRLTPPELRKLAVEILSVSIGIILAVTLALNFLTSGSLTWSAFTSLSLALVWLYAAIPLILWKHPWLCYAVLGPSTLLGVFLYFVFLGRLDWFVALALPLTILVQGLIVASSVLVKVSKRKGLNAGGIVLAALALLCLGIDLFLTRFATGSFALGWSLVVALSSIPVAGLFFYLHYRVMNRASLRKLFHL